MNFEKINFMLFNSIDFAVFLPIVFAIYWGIGRNNLKSQNLLVVIASYVFYGWWDWRFLGLITFSSLIDFSIGIKLNPNTPDLKRKSWLWVSLIVNLGLLSLFKYFNFFIDNFAEAFTFFGYTIEAYHLNLILPVGISFYTFQTLSYTIDVYRKDLKATRDFVAFSAFVSFFPQLVAGPIERATHLLPQFESSRTFDYHLAVDGLKQMLWGLFKKIVIADNCARYANLIFDDYGEYNGSALVLGAVLFTFQIYGDFSGYSDIAIGTSRLFGFDLMQNFNFPYFSRDIAEFWRRWHISLSTWFRDYLYIPLGGSRGGTGMKVRNTFVIFVVSGFWHGANWTFIVWGALNAAYFLPLLLRGKNRSNLGILAEGKVLPSSSEFMSISGTFALTVLAWIFFRSDSIGDATAYISGILSKSVMELPNIEDFRSVIVVIALLITFVCLEWTGRMGQYGIQNIGERWPRIVRWGFYSSLIFIMGMFMQSSETPFIYFQF